MTKEAAIRLLMDLRQAGITNTRVLAAMERTPRELFVPPAYREAAYDNIALPVGLGQTISQPLVVAFMTQELKVDRRTKVLEVGTGTGYQAAILARLCRRVYTIERHRELLRQAEARFAELRLHNITTRLGDGTKGWPEQAPFGRIMVTAASEEVPPVLVDQLAVGGLMVIPLGRDRFGQELVRLRRVDSGQEMEALMGVRFVPLVPGEASESRTG